jgi:hypothetical protein
MTRLDQRRVLVSLGTSNAAVARLPGVSDGAVPCQLGRMAAGAVAAAAPRR